MKILFHTETGSTRPYPRGDDLPVVGLSPEYQVFDLIASAPPGHNPESWFARRLPEVIDVEAKTVTRGWELVPITPRPVVVSMRSFRRAMGRARYLELMAFVAAITDAEQKYQAQTFLEYSLTVARDHPMVSQFSAALGKPAEEVDAIFAAAKQLDESA